jgi:hypothetical protein
MRSKRIFETTKTVESCLNLDFDNFFLFHKLKCGLAVDPKYEFTFNAVFLYSVEIIITHFYEAITQLGYEVH